MSPRRRKINLWLAMNAISITNSTQLVTERKVDIVNQYNHRSLQFCFPLTKWCTTQYKANIDISASLVNHQLDDQGLILKQVTAIVFENQSNVKFIQNEAPSRGLMKQCKFECALLDVASAVAVNAPSTSLKARL